MTDRKSAKVEAGLIHAEIVNELARFKEFEFRTVTTSSMPSKYNAPPTFPVVQIGPWVNVPVCAFPEESQAVVPDFSSNFQCATSPDALAVGGVVGVEAEVDRMRPPGAFGAWVAHWE